MRESFLDICGARLWLADQGAGRPLMLCSGGPGCCDHLAPVAALLAGSARVLRFEPRGCGRSSPDGPFDLDTTLADLDALRSAMGLERWIIGGHSWGADLALAYALTYPARCLGLVYLSGRGLQNDRDWHAAYRAGRDAGLEVPLDDAYPLNKEVNRVANASWKAFLKRPNLWRSVAALDVPALLVHGSADIRPAWPVKQLAQLLPDARYVELGGADHHLWLGRADGLGEVVRAFVAELGPPTRQPGAG